MIDEGVDSSNDNCPWELEHGKNSGFLLGDPICLSSETLSAVVPFWEAGIISALNTETVLMDSSDLNFLSVINLRKLKENKENSGTIVKDIAFSPNGATLYVISTDGTRQTTVTAWDVSNGNKMCGRLNILLISFIPVKEGIVLLLQNKQQPELWNVELTECIRRWNTLERITKMIAISQELIACVGMEGEVNILAALAAGGIEVKRCVIACNSKHDLITVGQRHRYHNFKDSGTEGTLGMSNDTSLIWERDVTVPLCGEHALPYCIFCPKEDFIVVWGEPLIDGPGVHILDAASGNTHHTLANSKNVVDCKFVSDEEILVYNKVINVLRLFNVNSGDLLSVMDIEERPCCVAVCLYRHLIAVCLKGFAFKHIRVWSPRSKEKRQNKRLVY